MASAVAAPAPHRVVWHPAPKEPTRSSLRRKNLEPLQWWRPSQALARRGPAPTRQGPQPTAAAAVAAAVSTVVAASVPLAGVVDSEHRSRGSTAWRGQAARRAAGAVPGAGSGTVISLLAQIPGRTFQQLSGLFTHKKIEWAYEEPHWIVLVQLALVVFWRALVDRRFASRIATSWHRVEEWAAAARGRLALARARVKARLARRRRSWQARAKSAGAADKSAAAAPSTSADAGQATGSSATAGESRDSEATPEGEQSSSAAPDKERLVVRGEGPVEPLEPQAVPKAEVKAAAVSSFAATKLDTQKWLRLLGAAEAPLLILFVVSTACHIVVAAMQALHLSGVAEGAAEVISRVWVLQLLNYTVSTWWLAVRLLNEQLAQSTSRPKVSGDLSNLEESVPATSRRFAHESSMVQLAKAAVSLVAVLTCLKHLGYNISKLLAVTSLSGVVFSFLLGDLLANLFASFVLYLTQPFAQGDWVQSPDGKVDGWIQTVGWYYTTVMRWEKRPHYIPNSNFGYMPLVNCSRMTHRRILFEGPLRTRDLDKVEEILKDVRSMVENHNDIDKSMHRLCRLKEINDFFVTLWVSCYTRHITLAKFLQVQESILLGVCAILRKHGTNWASSLERFHTAGGQTGENAELTSEFRRLLNARSALLAHERDLEERNAALQEGSREQEKLGAKVAQMREEAAAKTASYERYLELTTSRKQSLSNRKRALSAKSNAMMRRKEAMQKLEESVRVFEQSPSRASNLHQEALEMREQSVEMAWRAVIMEQGSIEWEKDALQQEISMLEKKRETPVSAAAAPPAEPEPPSASSGAATSAEFAQNDFLQGCLSKVDSNRGSAPPAEPPAPPAAAATAAAPAGGTAAASSAAAAAEDPEAVATEAPASTPSSEADASDMREQAAVAIGGE